MHAFIGRWTSAVMYITVSVPNYERINVEKKNEIVSKLLSVEVVGDPVEIAVIDPYFYIHDYKRICLKSLRLECKGHHLEIMGYSILFECSSNEIQVTFVLNI